jgi:hypothetical protein
MYGNLLLNLTNNVFSFSGKIFSFSLDFLDDVHDEYGIVLNMEVSKWIQCAPSSVLFFFFSHIKTLRKQPTAPVIKDSHRH